MWSFKGTNGAPTVALDTSYVDDNGDKVRSGQPLTTTVLVTALALDLACASHLENAPRHYDDDSQHQSREQHKEPK